MLCVCVSVCIHKNIAFRVVIDIENSLILNLKKNKLICQFLNLIYTQFQSIEFLVFACVNWLDEILEVYTLALK